MKSRRFFCSAKMRFHEKNCKNFKLIKVRENAKIDGIICGRDFFSGLFRLFANTSSWRNFCKRIFFFGLANPEIKDLKSYLKTLKKSFRFFKKIQTKLLLKSINFLIWSTYLRVEIVKTHTNFRIFCFSDLENSIILSLFGKPTSTKSVQQMLS